MGSQRQALELTGVARSTWQNRLKPRRRVADPKPQKDRAYSTRLEADAVAQIEQLIRDGWERDMSVDYAFATAWDNGIMLGSRRTWWRIALRVAIDGAVRPQLRGKKNTRQEREKPVLSATGPGQVWSWDITDVHSPWRGKSFKVYSIIDIFSRKVVGYCTQSRESDALAVQMFRESVDRFGAPRVVHADSGAAMRSNALRNFLETYDVELTFNRPYVSNDNPFSESAFRTMKYRPGYPVVFDDLEKARLYIDEYVAWYNQQHKHSGIALFSPDEVHDGSWEERWTHRDDVLLEYYRQYPQRFNRPPVTPVPAGIVGINLPSEEHINL